jgi:hypothetical protein
MKKNIAARFTCNFPEEAASAKGYSVKEGGGV